MPSVSRVAGPGALVKRPCCDLLDQAPAAVGASRNLALRHGGGYPGRPPPSVRAAATIPACQTRTVHIAELWRYPVKSLQGEQVTETDIGPVGLAGDRHWALVDLQTGHTLTARREPKLLFASGRLSGDGVELTLPDGTKTADNDVLTAWLGRPVTLREASTAMTATYEIAVDSEDETGSEWVSWQGPDAAFHDSGDARVSLLSTATIDGWDRRRFRPNILLEGGGEDGLVGSTVALGTARLQVVKHIERCVMTTRPQSGGIDRDLDVLRTINRDRAGLLAVGALVSTPGRARVGDAIGA